MAVVKPRPTLADYVAIAIGPCLIMALVVSLIYFLIEILYAGGFVGRLQWIFFFYIFGSVLVARISMASEIADRAPLYAIVMAILVWIGMGQFVDMPADLAKISWFINAGLIALIWWSTHRLTWDCTHIDEKSESNSAGLLQATGLGTDAETPPSEPSEEPTGKKRKRVPMWSRYKRYLEERKKKHTPGVWVVYYSLAALPLFGLGQALIPVEEEDRRRYVFWLMAIYAASALGLLVTTAFLSLRRYLRQRGLQMPRAVTTIWLTSGAILTFCLLVIGALLPRPQAEYSLLSLTPVGSLDRDASRFAQTGEDKGKGDGRAGSQEFDEKKGAPVDSKSKDKQGSGGQGKAKGQGSGQKNDGKGGSSKGQGEKGSDAKGRKSDGKKGDEAKGDNKGSDDTKGDNKDDSGSGNNEKSRDPKAGKTSGSGSNRRSSGSTWSPPALLGKVGTVLKWVVFGILAVLFIVFLLRGGLRYLANFFEWARRLLESLRAFWESLFGGAATVPASGEGKEWVEERRPLRPFRSYPNPFSDGQAEGMSPAEVVRYSFEALEAWAHEREVGRRDAETALEFADRLGNEVPSLEAEARRLANLYARVLYARGGVPANWRTALEGFWAKIESVTKQPLSAGT